ncbi:MAG: methylated-DNA--[protein]-cysteine S-methyltransferase [Gaiellaceae bacterium]
MRATETRYVVPGWGGGELWTSSVAVLAHEFAFEPEQLLAARPLEGAVGPPTGTLPGQHTREADGFVPTSRREPEAAQPPDLDLSLDLDPHELVARVAAYLAGADVGFDAVRLDLDDCTPFQRAVAATLRDVPRGTVVSYAELAALAGYPGAQRAVGTFCARNRFAFLLPCHRVVGADGIGGYGSAGVAVKRRLLALEGVTGLAA